MDSKLGIRDTQKTKAGYKFKSSKNDKLYIRISILNCHHKAHRLAWIYVHGSLDDDIEIDHINGDGTDNRMSNLRLVDRRENCKNLAMNSKNRSGVAGVHWYKARSKWAAEIQCNGVKHFVGCFDDLDDARNARLRYEDRLGFHKNHTKRKAQ